MSDGLAKSRFHLALGSLRRRREGRGGCDVAVYTRKMAVIHAVPGWWPHRRRRFCVWVWCVFVFQVNYHHQPKPSASRPPPGPRILDLTVVVAVDFASGNITATLCIF